MLQFLVVAVFVFLGRDAITGTIMASVSATWLVNTLLLAFAPVGAANADGIFGLTFAVFAAVMCSVARPKIALAAVLAVAVPRYATTGLYVTHMSWLGYVAGGFGALLSIVALYCASALLIDDIRGHTVIPVGRSGPARAAIEGGLSDQLGVVAG